MTKQEKQDQLVTLSKLDESSKQSKTLRKQVIALSCKVDTLHKEKTKMFQDACIQLQEAKEKAASWMDKYFKNKEDYRTCHQTMADIISERAATIHEQKLRIGELESECSDRVKSCVATRETIISQRETIARLNMKYNAVLLVVPIAGMLALVLTILIVASS